HAHLVFGLGVPRLHIGKRDRPVQQIRAGHAAIRASDPEFMLGEPQRRERPPDLTIHAGRLGKSLATRQLPDVVRISVHASCVKLSHSLLMKSCSSVRGPASRITTLTPFWASSLPNAPPPAPEPTITTRPSSFRSNFAMIEVLPTRSFSNRICA